MSAWLKFGMRQVTRLPGLTLAVKALDTAQRETEPLLRVLTYHRVDEVHANPSLHPSLISATPAEFARQMGFLAHHFRVVSLKTVLEYVRRQRPLPPRAVLLTFDDAYHDFERHAWPVLKKYQLPVTLFVPTGFPNRDRAFWWDRLYALAQHMTDGQTAYDPGTQSERLKRMYERLERQVLTQSSDDPEKCVEQRCRVAGLPHATSAVLGWDALHRLAREGVTLAPHTRSHPLLDRISLEQARLELTESLADLQCRFGNVPPVVAYPGGAHNDRVRRIAAESGYELAFTTQRGLNRLRHLDLHRVRRINVGRRCSLPLLHCQLLPGMVHLNRCWT